MKRRLEVSFRIDMYPTEIEDASSVEDQLRELRILRGLINYTVSRDGSQRHYHFTLELSPGAEHLGVTSFYGLDQYMKSTKPRIDAEEADYEIGLFDELYKAKKL